MMPEPDLPHAALPPERTASHKTPQKNIARQHTQPLFDCTFQFSADKRAVPCTERPNRRRFKIVRSNRLPPNFFGEPESKELIKHIATERFISHPPQDYRGTPHFNQLEEERRYRSLAVDQDHREAFKGSFERRKELLFSRARQHQTRTISGVSARDSLHEQCKSMQVKTIETKESAPQFRQGEGSELQHFGDLLKSLLQKRTKQTSTSSQYRRPKLNILPPLRHLTHQPIQ